VAGNDRPESLDGAHDRPTNFPGDLIPDATVIGL
jgi:hypothetical protein